MAPAGDIRAPPGNCCSLTLLVQPRTTETIMTDGQVDITIHFQSEIFITEPLTWWEHGGAKITLKSPKYSDTQQFAVITLKFEQDGFTKE